MLGDDHHQEVHELAIKQTASGQFTVTSSSALWPQLGSQPPIRR